ncbi:MAG TPA: hypothetical protein VHA12_01750 [Candidatus Nanoarchaeia archaeon]|nr:hypothetical protein [Candidatus Nanoarchaeia archaeon]
MKVNQETLERKPVRQLTGTIATARVLNSSASLEAHIALEIKEKGKPSQVVTIPCKTSDFSTIKFVTPKLINEKVYYEFGNYIQMPVNQIVGDYSFFRIKSGQFNGASFP